MNTGDKQETLLSLYATPEEIAEVQVAREAVIQAEQKVAHVLTTLRRVDVQLADAQRAVRPNLARAAALALGEDVDAEEPRPMAADRAQLEAQFNGLKQRLKDEEEMVINHKGKFRAAVVSLLEACAQRCAADYQAATAQQAWCYQQLSVAQEVVGAARPIVDSLTWHRYFVPSSTHLAALKPHARQEYGIGVLMSADRLNYERKEEIRRLQAHATTLFGSWPC